MPVQNQSVVLKVVRSGAPGFERQAKNPWSLLGISAWFDDELFYRLVTSS